MRKFLSAIPLLMTLLLVGTVEAATTWSQVDVKITSVTVNEDAVYITFAPAPFSGVNCSRAREGAYVLGGNAAAIDKLTSIATQALVNSRNVRVATHSTCSAGGQDGYPVATGLTLK